MTGFWHFYFDSYPPWEPGCSTLLPSHLRGDRSAIVWDLALPSSSRHAAADSQP